MSPFRNRRFPVRPSLFAFGSFSISAGSNPDRRSEKLGFGRFSPSGLEDRVFILVPRFRYGAHFPAGELFPFRKIRSATDRKISASGRACGSSCAVPESLPAVWSRISRENGRTGIRKAVLLPRSRRLSPVRERFGRRSLSRRRTANLPSVLPPRKPRLSGSRKTGAVAVGRPGISYFPDAAADPGTGRQFSISFRYLTR